MEHGKTTQLQLTDYRSIWSKFCFLDESGNLGASTRDPFFTIGLIKCSQPYYLCSSLRYERQKRQFYDELKFNKLSRLNIDFAKVVVDKFFDTRSIYFYSYTIDNAGSYFQKTFSHDPWCAYEEITHRVLEAALSPNEVLILIADHVDVPKHVRYEVDVKNKFNDKHSRLALAGVCRFDSKSNDLLQVVDLFIGAINYDLKMQAGIIGKGDHFKKELLEYIKSNLGVQTFCDGFRNRAFNIFVDKDMKCRCMSGEHDKTKKELSS
jgi:hypothetical protein